jgi:segregation and condensation protein A
MEYTVLINEFEGPLDLLLHLIKKEDIEIMDINIEAITKQYLDYLKAMEEINLDIASEYLVMAAELMLIKSSSLLPNQEEDEEVEELKENLINKLIAYQKYKELLPELKELEIERQEIYTKIKEDINSYKDEELNLEGITLESLTNAFLKFLNKQEEKKPLNTKVTHKEYSVTKRSNEIKQILKEKNKVSFDELFEVLTKSYVVVTFLSILELSRNRELVITQDNNFDKIYLERGKYE